MDVPAPVVELIGAAARAEGLGRPVVSLHAPASRELAEVLTGEPVPVLVLTGVRGSSGTGRTLQGASYRFVHLPIFGGTIIGAPADRGRSLETLLDELELSSTVRRVVEEVESARERAGTPGGTPPQYDAALLRRLDQQAAELADLRLALSRERAQAARPKPAPAPQPGAAPSADAAPRPTAQAAPAPNASAPSGASADDPLLNRVTSVAGGAAIVEALGWPGPPDDADQPLALDRYGVVTTDPGAPHVVIRAGADAGALRRTAWAVLQHAFRPVRVTIAASPSAAPDVRAAAEQIVLAVPGLEAGAASPDGDALVVESGTLPAPGWLLDAKRPASVAYVLGDVGEDGSGGSRSVLQEALALAALGIRTSVVVPADVAETARAVHPEAADLLVPADGAAATIEALRAAEVAVATEPATVDLVGRATGSGGTTGAYCVHDYEPLLGPEEGPTADRALISYRSEPRLWLFARTHWLGNLVSSRHRTPVAKVRPGLDTDVFHPGDRAPAGSAGPLRVCAMLRPRAPRRRAAATVALLDALLAASPTGLEVVTFGCTEEERGALGGGPGVEHRGLLTPPEVAELLRGADAFVDLSAYQALGRLGLEAMACGAVPVLPKLGGTGEYAVDGRTALLVDTADLAACTEAVLSLLGDRERLRTMSEDGRDVAAGFGLDAAADQVSAVLAAFVAAERAGHGAP